LDENTIYSIIYTLNAMPLASITRKFPQMTGHFAAQTRNLPESQESCGSSCG
jgi:hypothetical protein